MTNTDLTYLLTRLLQKVPHARSAVLLSTDGMVKFADGMSKEEAEPLAAIASSLFSLTRQVSKRYGTDRGVRQVASEMDDCILLVTAAGKGSVLAVMAGDAVDIGNLGYEMAHLAAQVPDYLSTATRENAAPFGTP